ncbi:hypothetical protein HK098_003719 [Nowakowskiella sp. JEL0407]|nr:hypothetical protein HK098_003719 [Nowakowskiella sp. JEL0407]
MVVGILHVIVVGARHLSDKDFVGKSDPYCEVYVDKRHKQKTSVQSGTLNPTWNESFKIAVNGEDKLHIRVLDKDVLDSDSIGSAEVKIEEIARAGNWEGWVKLPKFFGLSSHGDVHIVASFESA